MTEISERYNRLADEFAAKIAAVPADRWTEQSPCPEWTALDVVRHVITTQGMFQGLVGRSMPDDMPSVDADPLVAWNAARAVTQADLDDPARATEEFDGGMGRMSFENAVDRFLCFDLVVHGWDLAHATGLDEGIAPQDLDHVRVQAEGFGDAMRGPQAFGPEVQPPPGADDQQKLLAFLGRNP